ncbi:MAG: hypothetical protein ABH807_01505 [Candidatus Shapirobacteria bacterium]
MTGRSGLMSLAQKYQNTEGKKILRVSSQKTPEFPNLSPYLSLKDLGYTEGAHSKAEKLAEEFFESMPEPPDKVLIAGGADGGTLAMGKIIAFAKKRAREVEYTTIVHYPN